MKIVKAESIQKEKWLEVIAQMPYSNFVAVCRLQTPIMDYIYRVGEKEDSFQNRMDFLEYLMFKIDDFTKSKINMFNGESL